MLVEVLHNNKTAYLLGLLAVTVGGCCDDGGSKQAPLADEAAISRDGGVTVVVRWGAAPRRRGGRAARCFVARDGSDEEEPEGIL